MPELFAPLGLIRALEEDFQRLSRGLADSATAILEAGSALGEQLRDLDVALIPGWSHNPGRRGRPPAVDRMEVLRLHAQGLTPREIAARVGVTDVRVSQIIREEGLQPHTAPRAIPTARELAAEQRRQDILRLHGRGLAPSAVAAELEVSADRAVRLLRECCPPPPRPSPLLEPVLA